ncbi:MAG: thioredoxin [Deltaproteobacteria bacterium]|nr:thioredoxin [Deltaproteobacteria bacterium]
MTGEGLLIHLNDDSFDEVIKVEGSVLVDFWAPWCSPCLAMGPAIEEIAQEYEGRVRVAKVNVDENPLIADKHGIKGIPTVLFFKNGKLVDTLTGLMPKGRLEESLKKVL